MSASDPGPRVTGLETEFGVLCAPAGSPEAAKEDLPDVEQAAALIFRHRPVGYRSTNLFLPNGGRLYLDIGAHPEYATAECVRVRDLVAQDQAGREILADMAERAAAGLAQKGTSARFHLLANNTDSAGHTYGCHESYSVPRHLLDDASGTQGVDAGRGETTMAVLTSFLATRPVLVGSGRPLESAAAGSDPDCQRREDEEASWGLSPRAPHLKALASADTTGQRALVNTRDEPHADAARLRRLHVTCADTTIAEPTTGLRSALTLLLLDALEAGWDFTDLVLADPLATLSALGESPWGDVPAVTDDGRRLSAVDLQEAFLERLTSYLGDVGEPDFLRGAEHLLTDLAPSPRCATMTTAPSTPRSTGPSSAASCAPSASATPSSRGRCWTRCARGSIWPTTTSTPRPGWPHAWLPRGPWCVCASLQRSSAPVTRPRQRAQPCAEHSSRPVWRWAPTSL